MRIFLVVLLVLVLGAAGGGYWAYQYDDGPIGERLRGQVATVLVIGEDEDGDTDKSDGGDSSETVKELIWQNRSAFDEGSAKKALKSVDKTIRQIAKKNGKKSEAHVRSLVETVVMLNNAEHLDLALPYMKKAEALSREVYGVSHRETATSIHDLAVVMIETSEDKYAPEAEALLREALDIRRDLLGTDHGETAGAETFLAEQLLKKWQLLPNKELRKDVLTEAAALSDHSAVVYNRIHPQGHFLIVNAALLSANIAAAQGYYEKSEQLFRAAFLSLDDQSRFVSFYVLADDYKAFEDVLRKMGREEEADQLAKEVGMGQLANQEALDAAKNAPTP